MDFQYRPLNPNEIRLLKPLSRSSGLLSFKIVHVSLLSKPQYAALSYTWGSPGDTYSILLNGQQFPVRHNLQDALQTIQSSKLVDQYLWVDAICINQGENDVAKNERSCQITHMTKIYEQAVKILVWLGKPENEANNRLAFLMMKDFDRRYFKMQTKARPYRPWWWQTEARTPGDDIADFMLTISPTTDKGVFDVPGSRTYNAWLGIVSLWKKPWWTRTWIFQESTIPESWVTTHWMGHRVKPASSKVRFLCGDQETGWSAILMGCLVSTNIISTPGIDSRFLVGAQRAAAKLISFREQRVLGHLRSFLDILQHFRHTECFDPRDKVYAPLCLASNDVRRNIIPNYTRKTVLDVYMDVVRLCLAQPGNALDFLGHALYQEGTQIVETPEGIISILPSWVPNFSAKENIVPIPKILYVPEELGPKGLKLTDRRGFPNQKEAISAAYRPLGGTPSMSFIKDNMLCVSGVFIDVIKDKIPNTGPDLVAIAAVGKEKGRRWAIDSNHKYFTGESFSDAVKSTIVLDLVNDDRSRPSLRGGKLDSVFLHKPRAGLSLKEYRSQLNMKSAQTKASILRDLGISEKLYLLMVPNTAVAGDVVWALAGGQVLYTLRPISRDMNQYTFIGECYVHGLMDGEILRRLHLGEARMEKISLV